MIRKGLGAFAASALLLAPTGALAQTTSTLAASAIPTTQADREHAGFLKAVQGTVYLTSPAGTQSVAKSGDPVALVDRIETGPDSGASVVLRDGTMIVVGPSSRLDLRQFAYDATSQDGSLAVSLLKGSLRMITGLLGKKPENIRIDTQTATIGIRGTDFIVTVDDKV